MTKKEICEILKIDNGTLKNWERDRPELHKVVISHFEENKEYPNLNNPDYLKSEMIKAIDKLPEHKTKKFYHLMMAELAEMGH